MVNEIDDIIHKISVKKQTTIVEPKVEKKITKKTKGVIVVHMAGYPCEIDKISNYCKKKK